MTEAGLLSAAAEKSLSNDIAVLERKWRAALQPGETLPRYEDVMLGSLGRLADHIVLLSGQPDALTVSRSGRYVEQWLDASAQGAPLAVLAPDCATALGEAVACASQNNEPYLGSAHCVRDGMVRRYQVLALPTVSRWGRALYGVYVNESGDRYNLLDAVFRSTDDGIMSLAIIRDAAGRPFDFQIVHLNTAAARHFGVPVDHLQWQRLRASDTVLGQRAVRDRLLDVVASGQVAQLELERGDRTLQLGASVFGGMLSLAIADVTGLKTREQSFRLLFDHNPMPMWVFDAQTSAFLGVNDAAVNHYGYERAAFLRMKLHQIWPQEEWDVHRQALRQVGDAYHSSRNWTHVRADGSQIQVLTFGRRIEFGGRDGYLVAVADITERRKAEARIAHMAHHDGLTNLPNRVLYQQSLRQALEHAQVNGGRVAVLCIDLDLFKSVNDSYGHPMGDRLLVQVAERLRTAMLANNLVARLGGDEFAVVLAADTSPREAGDHAMRLIELISAPYRIDGVELVIGASVGIALSPGDGCSSEELMRNADMALYRAKGDGGGVSCFFEAEMDRKAQKRRAMETDLRRAFAHGEFELHYQPLVNLAANRISGFEALLRWRHPHKGMVSPMDFIPLAEDIGLIVGIGEWALRRACMEAASWPDHIKVAVNLSPVQFRSRNLVQTVVSALAHSRLAPQRLELEITESVFLAETEANIATLHQLRDLGVSFAMDDFGTGYSSLSYLRSFPFDKIKIDRSFVKDLARRSDCSAIIRAIAGLGRSLDITTTAEGVETPDQLDWLRAEGCNEVQGYLFSAALPPQDIAALLRDFETRASRAA